ncbi:hypothetical protein ZIOFF_060794 [Zingiber officinale]|uniref:Peptidase M16 N-terminal domain-containing protein n=1 Tax=Zingiber officinale TaxID=94328 RepID=A0A8J5FAA9_ZINOF|nr:hypothetical protein ZIOFF_060794 [Zingiber officinale]
MREQYRTPYGWPRTRNEHREIEILKSRCDKREYRRIVLLNFLKALIISDPETDKTVASMNIPVSSFSYPDGLEGLAHLLGKGLMNLSFASKVSRNVFRHINMLMAMIEQAGFG